MNKKNEKNFESALKRLEQISDLLENEETPLEESIKLFEEGIELKEYCEEKLKSAKVKIDKIVTILAKTKEFSQSKSAKVIAEVRYYDNKKNLIEKFPLESEFWFRNIYLEFSGDKRVLSKKDKRLLKGGFLPFPPDEVLLFNNSENIKQKLKNIIYNSTE